MDPIGTQLVYDYLFRKKSSVNMKIKTNADLFVPDLFTEQQNKAQKLSFLTPLHSNISIHILRAFPIHFPRCFTRRICLTIRGFCSW